MRALSSKLALGSSVGTNVSLQDRGGVGLTQLVIARQMGSHVDDAAATSLHVAQAGLFAGRTPPPLGTSEKPIWSGADAIG